MPTYEQTVRNLRDHFGEQPTPLILRHQHLFAPGSRILDLGVGRGRNALMLARKGLNVTGLDQSEDAIRAAANLAKTSGVQLDLWHGDFQRFSPTKPFDAVLVIAVLHQLVVPDRRTLLRKLEQWTTPGGLAMMAGWYIDEKHALDGKRQILKALGKWQVLYQWEGQGPVHHHGDGKMERHHGVELILRKP